MKVRMFKNLGLLAFLILLIGCNNNPGSQKEGFTPPKDNIVTEKMAKRYAKVSVALTEAVKEQAAELQSFREKYNISETMNELSDKSFQKEHPEIMSEWNSLQKSWEEKQDKVYTKYGMSEDEWDWIASALLMPRNKPKQEFIRKEIERLKKEGFPESKPPTDNN